MLSFRAMRISVSVIPSIFWALPSRSLLKNMMPVEASALLRFRRRADGRWNKGEGPMFAGVLGAAKSRRVVVVSGRGEGVAGLGRRPAHYHCSRYFPSSTSGGGRGTATRTVLGLCSGRCATGRRWQPTDVAGQVGAICVVGWGIREERGRPLSCTAPACRYEVLGNGAGVTESREEARARRVDEAMQKVWTGFPRFGRGGRTEIGIHAELYDENSRAKCSDDPSG